MKTRKHLWDMSAVVRSIAGTLGALALANACGGSGPRELGYTHDTQGSEPGTTVEPTEPVFTHLSEFTGRWVGEAEEPLAFAANGSSAPTYKFPSGSSQIVLELVLPPSSPQDEPPLRGTLTFGAGAPPPPATDPEVGYPVGLDWWSWLDYFHERNGILWDDQPRPPYEGFRYALSQVIYPEAVAPDHLRTELGYPFWQALADGLLRISYNTDQLIEGWCALQTPLPASTGGFTCAPSLGDLIVGMAADGSCWLYGSDREPVASYDCNKLLLCIERLCVCDEYTCAIDPERSVSELVLRRVGDTLVGEFEHAGFLNARGLRVPLGTVRFHPAP